MALASTDETDGNISTSDDQKSLYKVKVVKRQTKVKQSGVKNLLQAIVHILKASKWLQLYTDKSKMCVLVIKYCFLCILQNDEFVLIVNSLLWANPWAKYT